MATAALSALEQTCLANLTPAEIQCARNLGNSLEATARAKARRMGQEALTAADAIADDVTRACATAAGIRPGRIVVAKVVEEHRAQTAQRVTAAQGRLEAISKLSRALDAHEAKASAVKRAKANVARTNRAEATAPRSRAGLPLLRSSMTVGRVDGC